MLKNGIELVDKEEKNGAHSAEDILENFEHEDAAKYGYKLCETYGEPDEYFEGFLCWEGISEFDKVWIKDESVPHSFPKDHRDYLYSSAEIEFTPDDVATWAYVTGSIIADGLKQEVTVRCSGLIMNAISLQFAEDVTTGKAPRDKLKAKAEYGRRIMERKAPSWFENEIGD